MFTTRPNLFAALFALLLTATVFQQAITVPPATTVNIGGFSIA